MPIHDFECAACGSRFEELVAADAAAPPCPECGASGSRKLIATRVSPPGRLPQGAKRRDSDGRRSEREAARSDRISTAQKRRAAGGSPRPGGGDG